MLYLILYVQQEERPVARRPVNPEVLFFKRLIAATLALIILILSTLTIVFGVRLLRTSSKLEDTSARLEEMEMAELERLAAEEAERLKNALQPERIKPAGEASAPEILANARIVAHALGTVDGVEGLNCLEGFQQHYAAGVRVFEADFRMTSDGYVVLRHDWTGGLQQDIRTTAIPTREEFLAAPILGRYTPLSFQDLLLLMTEYPDVCIVTDTKFLEAEEVTLQFRSMLNEAHKLGLTYLFDRFFIQVYSVSHYTIVNNLYHFPHYIYTLYQDNFSETEDAFREKVTFCEQNGIEGLTLWDYWWDPDYAAIADWHHVKVYAHTVNDADKARRLIDSGVSAVYTDVLDPADLGG